MRLPFFSSTAAHEAKELKDKEEKKKNKNKGKAAAVGSNLSSPNTVRSIDPATAGWVSSSSSASTPTSSSSSSSADNNDHSVSSKTVAPLHSPTSSRSQRPRPSGAGTVTKEDLAVVLSCFLDESTDAITAEADLDAGAVSDEELTLLLAQMPQEDELRATFRVFDADRDGRITAEELRGVLALLGDDGCSVDDCRRMILEVDSVGDGFVCFPDFARMMLAAVDVQ